MTDTQRRLAWHGMFLFLLGLLMGAVVQSVANPRIGLSAHVGTLLNATFLIALAAVWGWMTLAPAVASAAYWLAVGGSYANCVSLFFAGVFGTSRSTPLHGAGHAGTPWQEGLVYAGLAGGAVAVLVASALAVWGLRRR
jgi:hydroxylaminobenzene mutase